jgi:predicted dehydrogenase
MHSILIIGCGSIGERHLRCFQRTGRARVIACDTNEDLLHAIARTYQVPILSDWEQAIDQEGIEAVVICTPAHLHIPMALRALRNGRHVLIEKPLSVSLKGVDELLRTHRQSGRQAAVAYVYHAIPFLIGARDYLLSGELGAVRHVITTGGQHFPTFRPAYARTYYRDRRTGGGGIQDGLTHVANWIESVIGPTDSVLCDCAHQVLADVNVEDTANLIARNGDILVSHTFNQFQAPNESTFQFNTATGSVKIEFHRRRWGVCLVGESDWTWNESPPADRDTYFSIQADYFLDQIDGGATRLCTLEAAVQTLRFNLAALASAETDARANCANIQPA